VGGLVLSCSSWGEGGREVSLRRRRRRRRKTRDGDE